MKKKKIKILHVAQAAGGVDRYIRMLLKYLDTSYVFYVHPDEIEAITREFAAIGNNLNQIAAFFNSGGIQSRAMLENINHAISCIFEMREQVAEMAGKNYGNAESVKYFREENDGKLPSLKSLKKRKEELTNEIAERKKAYTPLREESRRLEIASDNVYSIFRKTDEMKSDLAWKREWEAKVREKARQEQARQEQRERQPKRKKRSYDMSL